MIIKTFHINTADNTTTLQWNDHQLHCTSHNEADWLQYASGNATCCLDNCQMIIFSFYLSLIDGTTEMPQTKKLRSLDYLNKQTKKDDHRAEQMTFNYSHASALKRAGAPWWMNYIIRPTSSGTSSSLSSEGPCRHTLSTVLVVSKGQLPNHEKRTTYLWNIFAGGHARLVLGGFFYWTWFFGRW
jgi:hypothetical protein